MMRTSVCLVSLLALCASAYKSHGCGGRAAARVRARHQLCLATSPCACGCSREGCNCNGLCPGIEDSRSLSGARPQARAIPFPGPIGAAAPRWVRNDEYHGWFLIVGRHYVGWQGDDGHLWHYDEHGQPHLISGPALQQRGTCGPNGCGVSQFRQSYYQGNFSQPMRWQPSGCAGGVCR